MNNENYITIQGWMVNELKLKGNELLLYALIYGFTQDGISEFKGSLSYIESWLGISKPTIIDLGEKLVKKEYITKEIKDNNAHYKVVKFLNSNNSLLVKKLNTTSKKTLQPTSKETLHNIYNNNNNINIYKDIIDFLNLRAKKNFKHNIDKTKKCIQARINDGFVLDDFKKVIEVKTEQWKGDQMMDKFLRPETLFGNKFEGYLNEYQQKKHINLNDIKLTF